MNRKNSLSFYIGLVLFGCLIILWSSPAMAEAEAGLKDAGKSFVSLIILVKQSAEKWDGILRYYATRLFWLLASIQFLWTFFPLAIKRADFGEIIGELFRFIMTTGFFFAMLQFSNQWASAIVESFREVAGIASGHKGAIKPGDVFALAVKLSVMITSPSLFNVSMSLLFGLASIIVLLCFGFIAIFMALTLIESYIVINASVLFMGFGGSQWTRDFSLSILRYAVSVGTKLFVMTLLVGLITDAAYQWATVYKNDVSNMLTIIGLSLACAYFTKTIPELIAGLINGTSQGGGSTIGNMASIAAAGMASAASAILGSSAAAATSTTKNSSLADTINSAIKSNNQGSSIRANNSSLRSTNSPNFSSFSNPPLLENKALLENKQAPSPKTQNTNNPIVPIKPAQNQLTKATAAYPVKAPQISQDQGQTGTNSSGSNNSNNENTQNETQKNQESSNAQIASGVVKTAGILAAMSVPGMENSAALSLDLPPTGMESYKTKNEEENENIEHNIIRPAPLQQSTSPIQNAKNNINITKAQEVIPMKKPRIIENKK